MNFEEKRREQNSRASMKTIQEKSQEVENNMSRPLPAAWNPCFNKHFRRYNGSLLTKSRKSNWLKITETKGQVLTTL